MYSVTSSYRQHILKNDLTSLYQLQRQGAITCSGAYRHNRNLNHLAGSWLGTSIGKNEYAHVNLPSCTKLSCAFILLMDLTPSTAKHSYRFRSMATIPLATVQAPSTTIFKGLIKGHTVQQIYSTMCTTRISIWFSRLHIWA